MYKYKSKSSSKLVAIKLGVWAGKSSASLGRGLGEKHLVTNGVAWRLESHTGAVQ